MGGITGSLDVEFALEPQHLSSSKLGSAVDVWFALGGGEMQYCLPAGSNTNPSTQRLLARYQIPRSLYWFCNCRLELASALPYFAADDVLEQPVELGVDEKLARKL